jgi:hypothetical protein
MTSPLDARPDPQQVREKRTQIALLLNRLILASHASGYQRDREDVPVEDHITSDYLDELKEQILSAIALPAPGPVNDEPDEEMVPHQFMPRPDDALDEDGPIWCADCAYHRDHKIHQAALLASSAPEPTKEPQTSAAIQAEASARRPGMMVDVPSCPRCTEAHRVEVFPLAYPAEISVRTTNYEPMKVAQWTHWGICPTFGEPIFHGLALEYKAPDVEVIEARKPCGACCECRGVMCNADHPGHWCGVAPLPSKGVTAPSTDARPKE